jgi:hypothetical protein
MFSSRMMEHTAIEFDHVGLSGECMAGNAGMPCSQRSIWFSRASLRKRPGGACSGNKTSESTAQEHIVGIAKGPIPGRSTRRLSTCIDCCGLRQALKNPQTYTASAHPQLKDSKHPTLCVFICGSAYTCAWRALRRAGPCDPLRRMTHCCIASHPACPNAHQEHFLT